MLTDKRYTGQQRETTNGIYHYGARFYHADPSTPPAGGSGQALAGFIQADSIVPVARPAHLCTAGDPGGSPATRRRSTGILTS